MTDQVHKIEIANEQSRPLAPDRLISAVEQILTDHEIGRSEISIAIVDDPTIRALNKRYLEHDYETDVISFVLDYDEQQGALCGQLIVSSDTAQRMALEYGGSMQDEILLYVVHGSLHLVGYDDQEASDEEDMRAAETRYLSRFDVEHRWSPTASASESDAEVDSR